MNAYYVIERNEDRQIIFANDYDPLYGYGSWNMVSGPHPTFEVAAASALAKGQQKG